MANGHHLGKIEKLPYLGDGLTDHHKILVLQCGPMPNVMAALPNIGGALCSTPQSLAHAHY